MCRNRFEIIQEEVDVQKLIALKEQLQTGKINNFSAERKYFELEKLESDIESKINYHKMLDKLDENKKGIDKNSEAIENHIEEDHKKNPSLIKLFKESPTGVISFIGSFVVGSSLFYIKETRDLILNMLGFDVLTGETLALIGFPLFLFLVTMGIIAFVNKL